MSWYQDISGLGNHYRLEFYQLADCITDFNCLLHIPHITLINCNVKDVRVLQYAKSVYLSMCQSICDVSALRNVKTVAIFAERELSGLHELREVSDLSIHLINQKKLNCDFIPHLKNKKLLLSAHDLQVASLSMFSPMIKHLTIEWNEAISRLLNEGQGSSLHYLTSLTLKHLSVISLAGLEDIPTVKISCCDSLRNLRGLGRN